MRPARVVAWSVLACAVAALVYWAFRPQPVMVDLAVVARGPFERTVDDDGRTRVRDRYVVSAPLAGRLLRPALRVGDPVALGAVVATIVPGAPSLLDHRTVREMEERLAAAQAGVLRAAAMEERSRVAFDQARADARRSERLAQSGFLSPAGREQADLAVRLREKELEASRYEKSAAEREAAQARAALGRMRGDGRGESRRDSGFEVRAPVSGRVLRVIQESEAMVNVGAPLLEIGDTQRLEVVVDILSAEAATIVPGVPVHLEAGSGGRRLAGRVRLVEPAAFTKVSALGVEEQRVNVVIDFVSSHPDWANLGDGFRVDARIVVHQAADVVKVPSSALFRDADGYAVFVVEGDTVRKRRVDVPHRNDREGLVQSGLEPGERVVIFPGDALRDGARIAVRR